MHGTEIELWGFRGRTNKLVDGCYSWWCGGSFALLEALGIGGTQNADPEEDLSDEAWADIDGMHLTYLLVLAWACLTDVPFIYSDGLYDQKALQEYILYAGQHERKSFGSRKFWLSNGELYLQK